MNTLFGRSRSVTALTKGSPAIKTQLNQQAGVPIAGTKTRLATRASGLVTLFLSRLLFTLGVAGFALSAPAFAGKDDLYVSNVNSVTVGGSGAAYTTSLSGASKNRTLAITNPIVGAQAVSVQVTWGIAAGTAPRTTTFPNAGVTFSGSTTNGTSVGTISATPATCDFLNDTSTCSSTITFTTPNVTDSPIEVTIVSIPPSKSPGSRELQGRTLKIAFSVIRQVAKLDTTLAVMDPQCFQYGAGNVNLNATLTETVSSLPITGRTVDFSLDSNAIGSAVTDGAGEAVLSYNINGLSAGDHGLYAAFTGDGAYNPSGGSATLGIYYNFVGFQPPINPEGNSIFGNGRVLPVKIKIVDANLNPVADAQPTVWIYQWAPGTGLGEVIEAATSVSSADTDNIMRYVPEDQQYIYNWDLSSLGNGTYAVVVDLGDSDACGHGPYYATITVSKKGKK